MTTTTSSTYTYGTMSQSDAARSCAADNNDGHNDNTVDDGDVETGVFAEIINMFDINTDRRENRTGHETATDINVDPDNLVELATLILPKAAAEEGLEVGDGVQVVLEAERTTIEHIINSSAPDARLAAVVDLEVLGELVGESDIEALIADLRHEREHVHGEDVSASRPSPSAGGTTHHRRDFVDDERQSLLSVSSTTSPVTLYDRVSLEADPFIETLVGTFVENETRHASSSHGAPPLPTIFESTSASDLAATADLALDDVLGTQTEAASDQEHHVVQEAAATRTDNDNHIAHDAFLLNIPSESADGEMTDHFVLALPEIHADSDESVASTMSQVSEQPFPILQKAWSFLSEDLFLPSDIVSIQLEAHLESAVGDVGTVASSIKGEPSIVASTIGGGTFAILQAAELNLEVVVKRQVPVIGYIILISGLVALASVGAALDLQSGPSPLMKTLWRFNATSIVLSPLVVKSFCVDGLPDLTRRQVYMLPCAGAAYAYMCAAFVVALDMTTMANAFVLSNMTSLVIIFGRVLFRLPVLQMEGAGAIIGFTGAFICAQAAPLPAESGDGGLQTNFDDASIVMLGNAIALSASFGTAVYLIFAKSLRTSMDIFVFMFSIMSIAAICLLLYMVTSGEFFTWDMHPNYGIFGWLRLEHDRLFLDLYMAIICNCIGTTGYIAVMKYFEPIVPASVMLMEPVVGSLLGVLAGTATMPGAQTWIGDAIVAAGTFLVIYSGAKKTEKIDAAEALRPSTVGGDDASTMVSLLKSVKSGQSKQRKLSEDQTGIVSIPGSTKSVTKVIWEN